MPYRYPQPSGLAHGLFSPGDVRRLYQWPDSRLLAPAWPRNEDRFGRAAALQPAHQDFEGALIPFPECLLEGLRVARLASALVGGEHLRRSNQAWQEVQRQDVGDRLGCWFVSLFPDFVEVRAHRFA